MKKRLLAPIFGFILTFSLNSQTISPELISSAGDVDQTDKISLEWSLGEIAIDQHILNDRMFSEGFHQPTLTIEKVKNESAHILPQIHAYKNELDQVTVFPNPVRSELEIQFGAPFQVSINLEIVDLTGKHIYEKRLIPGVEKDQIQMHSLPPGLYLLNIYGPEQVKLQSFKISKN